MNKKININRMKRILSKRIKLPDEEVDSEMIVNAIHKLEANSKYNFRILAMLVAILDLTIIGVILALK